MIERKKILFISDFSPNENGYAGTQTAYKFIKLFDNCDYIILVSKSSSKEIKPNHEWKLNKDYFLFNYFFDYSVTNRINALFNLVKSFLNPRIFFFKNKLTKHIKDFNPDSIVCITNTSFIYKAATVVKKKSPNSDLFFYIMDDYRHYDEPYLLRMINTSFSTIKGWISISTSMAELFQSKFPELLKKPFIVLQNPVSINSIQLKTEKKNKNKIKLVYAGSVYPNHKDVLKRVIEAINSVASEIELYIYTKLVFRESFKSMESESVIYKGDLKYNDLLNDLVDYDYGLVAESFLPEFDNFAKSSIQTKINDYILTGCLPIVIGPNYGACINYINTNNIGYTLSDNSIESILAFLNTLIRDEKYNIKILGAQTYLQNTLRETKNVVTSFI